MSDLGLGLALGLCINNTNRVTGNDYLMSKEISRQNDLKEKELKQKEEHRKRSEWLEYLRRMADENLLSLLNNTDEFIVWEHFLKGGGVVLHKLPSTTEINNDYIDIKNECVVRGLIKVK